MAMNHDQLLGIFEELAAYFRERKVLAEDELRVKIRESVDLLTDEARAALERRLGGNLEEALFASITSPDKISLFSPDLRTRINYQGEVFYCLPIHGYLAEELEAAFLRWAKLKTPLGVLKKVLTRFLERSGYRITAESGGCGTDHIELSAAKGDEPGKRLRLFLFPSIKFVPRFVEEHPEGWEQLPGGEEQVIVVPTEKTPAPFISFVREQEIADALIWVVDLANRTVNPFIGTPRDPALESNFENPEQARRAVSEWMRKMHRID
jgi:hypothetical protein